MREQTQRQTAVLDGVLRPALAEHGIRIQTCARGRQRATATSCTERFQRQIFPVLTPLAVGLGRPFPYISNLSLSLAVLVRDPQTGQETFARVKVPKEMLPRFVPVGDGRTFVPLENLIAEHLDTLFPGMEIVDYDIFRVTRDADFTVDDEADDLLRAVEQELRRRRFGEVVRVEVGAGMSPRLREPLVRALEIDEGELFEVDGLLDLKDLWDVVARLRLLRPARRAVERRSRSRGCSPTRTRSPTCWPRCARATSSSTTRTTRSRRRSSGWSSRRSPTRRCSRSSRPCTARATTRRSSRR